MTNWNYSIFWEWKKFKKRELLLPITNSDTCYQTTGALKEMCLFFDKLVGCVRFRSCTPPQEKPKDQTSVQMVVVGFLFSGYIHAWNRCNGALLSTLRCCFKSELTRADRQECQTMAGQPGTYCSLSQQKIQTNFGSHTLPLHRGDSN